jgi:hypothetical protein
MKNIIGGLITVPTFGVIKMGVFEETKTTSEATKEKIAELVKNYPVTVFQILNKQLNEQGLCLSIATLEGR